MGGLRLMLDEWINPRILDDHRKLTADGKLLFKPQLDACYQTFHNRFGPEVLARLEGENSSKRFTPHGNKDSLFDRLEFKNDDKFPARFDSISGGSAFNFGVFLRCEKDPLCIPDFGS
ncbi:MAG: hypothetical protein NVSMB9_33150 [Isosphaeraceae bacterium]